MMIEQTLDNYILFFKEKRKLYGRLWRKAIKATINSSESETRHFYAKQAKWFKAEWKKLDMIIFRLKICKQLTTDLPEGVDMLNYVNKIIMKYGGKNNEF